MQLKREKNNRTRLDIDINEIDYTNPNYRIMKSILKSDLKDFFDSESMTNMHIYVTVDMQNDIYYLSVYYNFMNVIIEQKQKYYSIPRNKIKRIIIHPESKLHKNKIQLAVEHICLDCREKGLTKLSKLFINHYNINRCSFIQIQGTDYRRYR